jgi:hypothetical protein
VWSEKLSEGKEGEFLLPLPGWWWGWVVPEKDSRASCSFLAWGSSIVSTISLLKKSIIYRALEKLRVQNKMG